jgi:aspartate 1-decarboxylase
MLRNLMRSKIHCATVTQADLNYQGSISIDENILIASNIAEYEQVDVLNINNGERFTTYTLKAKANSREIKINGAAARKAQIGDKIIIIAYGLYSQPLDKNHQPTTIILGENNIITQTEINN